MLLMENQIHMGSARNDIHKSSLFRPALCKAHHAIGFCEERMISTQTNVHTGMELCAALTHKNIPGLNCFAAESLNAEPLRF